MLESREATTRDGWKCGWSGYEATMAAASYPPPLNNCVVFFCLFSSAAYHSLCPLRENVCCVLVALPPAAPSAQRLLVEPDRKGMGVVMPCKRDLGLRVRCVFTDQDSVLRSRLSSQQHDSSMFKNRHHTCTTYYMHTFARAHTHSHMLHLALHSTSPSAFIRDPQVFFFFNSSIMYFFFKVVLWRVCTGSLVV